MFDVEDVAAAASGALRPGLIPERFSGVSIDTRTLRRGEAFVAIVGKNFDGHDFVRDAVHRGARGIIYSDEAKIRTFEEGVAYIRVPETTRALGAIARAHRLRLGVPVIGVTGSSGKTTTKEMIAWVLSARRRVLKNKGTQNNLIGVPLTLLALEPQYDICVVEMGTNRTGEIKQLAQIACPNVGVITNIGPSHLEFLQDLRGVYREKVSLLKNLSPPGIAIINKADIYLSKFARLVSRPFFFTGVNRECDVRATEISYEHGGVEFLVNGTHRFRLKHAALHNVANALAAVACGLIFGLSLDVIRERLEAFDSPDMRLKEHRLKKCIVIDDSYNSNPLSLKEAIDMLCRAKGVGRRILVMGDMMELGKKSAEFHAYFGRYIVRKGVDILVTLGHHTRETVSSAARAGMNAARMFHFADIGGVSKFLDESIREGDLLLIKGSRSLKMEAIVDALKERH